MPLMPDEKPTLEYGRPWAMRRGWSIDTTIRAVVAAIGLACLSLAGLLIWERFHADPIRDSFPWEALLLTIIGLPLLFVAWLVLRRLKWD